MYEQGVIRPPSEATSLLLRVSRNCPWNQCVFCPAYKGTKFSKRTVDEVKKDIDAMAVEYSAVRVTSAFLQDADSLLLPTGDLIAILEYLREKFPKIDRITTYARARTLKRKSVDELRLLREAGLTRVHAGLESGSETVLKLIKKGLTPEEIVTGGRHVMDAGLELSEYVMPGIGGRALSQEHAIETANVLNMVRPHFIRIRTFAMHPKSPMQRMVEEGTFVPMNDEETIGEIRLLVDHLDKMHSYFSCNDFSLNLLMQVDGFLDEKKDAHAQGARRVSCPLGEAEAGIYPPAALRLLSLPLKRRQRPGCHESGGAGDRKARKRGEGRLRPLHRRPQVLSTASAANGRLAMK